MSEFPKAPGAHEAAVQAVTPAAGELAIVGTEPNPHAHLFDPDAPDPGYTVEDAAVRPAVRPAIPAQTSYRSNYWNKPTDAQVNNAAEFGFDLTKQNKYFK